MASFCRITGHARSLPKPCYFPLLPPISPADAKKLCRITGKVTDKHFYSPIIAFAKPVCFDGLEGCKITKNENTCFVRLMLEMTKDNEKTLPQLEEVLAKMKNKRKKRVEINREYVYNVNDHKPLTSIILPPEMEEAIRIGELESLSMSKDSKHVNVKIRQGRIVKLNLTTLKFFEVEQRQDLYYGEGQSKEVLREQQEVQNERNKRKANTMARKKRFEALEAKAEAEELRDTVRPVPKKPRVKFNAKQRAEKLARMEAMMKEQKENKAIVLPKVESQAMKDAELQYERMLADMAEAHHSAMNMVVVSSGFNWKEAETAESAGFDWDSFPHEEWIDPVEVEQTTLPTEDVTVREDIQSLDIVASVETVTPTLPITDDLVKAVTEFKEEKLLKETENIVETLKTIKEANIIPSFNEIGNVAAAIEKGSVGYMVQKEEKTEFVSKEEYVESDTKAVSGVMVEVNEEKKFVAGQIIKLAEHESFVAGQTVETPQGKKFVPGQTVLTSSGDINFVPGQCVKDLDENVQFVAGQIFNTPEGPKFVAGQTVDRGDGKPVFVAGQTINTDDGPKFTPGEIIVDAYGEDCFVPGMAFPTEGGEKFVPGQTFQTDEGLSFKPGQILDTVEGPSFVPGKTFETPEGKKFIKGDLIQDEEGKVKFEHTPFEVPEIREWLLIPNKELQPLAFADRNVAGFIVTPTNTEAVKAGEKLYGDMVETQDTVQFYITGKLPKDIALDSKIIPGQLIVNETDKRFIPGKMMSTADGDKFVPGQTVTTTHGEEFIPGQIVESSEGPKFIPGQLVMTTQGEKFVPGQVIVEDEGPKFVPGQIIQTKNGATFIPGQMMTSDEGELFVPGQLVETNDGPRFVPGQVAESPEGPKFIPGTIIETDDGLKYVPPDAEEYDEDFEFSFQGFEVSMEELKLLMTNPADTQPHPTIMNEEGLIDSATLKKLAVDTVVVHGVTPEPPQPEKKKKKKRPRVQLDAEEDDKMEIDVPDDGTDKVEMLLKFLKASACVTESRREKEMRKLSKMLGEKEHDTMTSVQVDAMAYILSPINAEMLQAFMGDDENLITDIVDIVGETEAIIRNDEAKKTLRQAVQKIVTARCDKEVSEIIHLLDINPDNLLTDTHIQILLTEAVGIVCVTGNVEVAAMLEKFISEPSDPIALRDNKDVVSVLRQLIVLHRISDRDPEVARILQVLQSNPEGLKDRRKVRELLKSANFLLQSIKEEEEHKKFDIRHVASSKDIPNEVFKQIKEDQKEATKFMDTLPDELFQEIMNDKRCGESLLEALDSRQAGKAKTDLEKFKKGMAIVVAKESMQAVIPKEYSRSVCYGIIPYLLIDEEGFRFFERGLTGRKLAPARRIENTWYMPDSYYAKKPSFERTMSGECYSMVMLGRRRASTAQMLYTSLLPSSGPTRLTYPDGTTSDGGELMPYKKMPSRASNIIWSDLDGAPLTVHRKSSVKGVEYGDLEIDAPQAQQRKLSRGQTGDLELDDYEAGYIARRPTREEREDFGGHYKALVPFQPVVLEDIAEPLPICRSDTVANLLQKYSNYSSRREFGYKAPNSAWSRHLGATHKFIAGIPDYEEEQPRPAGEPPLEVSDQALVPVASPRPPSVPLEDEIRQRHSREKSRSLTPRAVSTSRDTSAFQRETSAYSRDENILETSSNDRESSYSSRDVVLRKREGSGIPQQRPRFSDIYEEDEEEVLSGKLSSKKQKKKKEQMQEMSDVPDYLMKSPQEMLPKGRPGGALERYRQRKALEAQGIYGFSLDLTNSMDSEQPEMVPPPPPPGQSPPSRSSRYQTQIGNESRTEGSQQRTSHSQSSRAERSYSHSLQGEESSDRVSRDQVHQTSQESSNVTPKDAYARAQESLIRATEDPNCHTLKAATRRHAPHCIYHQDTDEPYSRTSKEPQDPYQRISRDPYSREPEDPYSRASRDPYSQPPQDPYSRAPMDLYGQPFQDPYIRAPKDPYSQPPQDPYSRAPQEQYSRATRDPYGRPMQDPYSRAPQDTYNQGPQDPYSRGSQDSYSRNQGDSKEYTEWKARRRSQRGTEEISEQQNGDFAPHKAPRNVESYGQDSPSYGGNNGVYGYGGEGSYSSPYSSGGYGSGGYSPYTSYRGGGGEGYGSYGLGDQSAYGSYSNGHQTALTSPRKTIQYIDEDDSHTGRSLTPRQEERKAIGRLAQKYVMKSYTMNNQMMDDQ